jgi:hypothetical protein
MEYRVEIAFQILRHAAALPGGRSSNRIPGMEDVQPSLVWEHVDILEKCQYIEAEVHRMAAGGTITQGSIHGIKPLGRHLLSRGTFDGPDRFSIQLDAISNLEDEATGS